ncbi:hypothetical protein NA56DRAFT_649552 [Hyaloscypha hepaticicola]|uniref:Uncharacterized protein n=1 Tax=Hyaloscypha hepaticicola TaxID=2082293 RepID=A0A2J6PQW8_9HELO|nr:hypothetical protein NA56DRAFT_649552 [Hyaloscypha hepaticicola]
MASLSPSWNWLLRISFKSLIMIALWLVGIAEHGLLSVRTKQAQGRGEEVSSHHRPCLGEKIGWSMQG